MKSEPRHGKIRRRPRLGVAIAVVAGAFLAGGLLMAGLDRAGRDPAAAEVLASQSATASAATTSLEPFTAPAQSLPDPSIVSAAANPSPTVVEPMFSRHTYVLWHPASPWVVVNKVHPLNPADYAPPELVTLDGIPGGGDQQLIPEAAEALQALRAAAADAGAPFSVSTAYRSYGQQEGIFNEYVRAHGRAHAETMAARPGYTEHQTGKAVDIFQSQKCRLKICFGEEAAGVFVAEHAHEFGFIVRYPDGKQDITGYQYEPWHLRYVGVELAAEMRRTGVTTLEEFFGLPAAPDYAD